MPLLEWRSSCCSSHGSRALLVAAGILSLVCRQAAWTAQPRRRELLELGQGLKLGWACQGLQQG